jgi:hypothetical protein
MASGRSSDAWPVQARRGVGALTAPNRHIGVECRGTTPVEKDYQVTYFVYAVALLLLISLAIFVKVVVFDRRPQKTGLFFSLLAIPLLLIYYQDKWTDLFPGLKIREWVLSPFDRYNIHKDFQAALLPGFIIIFILLLHMLVLQRVAVRKRLERVHNPIANFFSGLVAATLIDATLVGTFQLGWVGAVIIAAVFILVYLGVIALVAALLEVVVAIVNYLWVWLKRRLFAIATMITRASSWLSSLSGRLGLQSFADKIRQETKEQEGIFTDEQEKQDRALYEAYLRDRAHRRRLIQGTPLPPEPAYGADVVPDTAPGDTPPPPVVPSVITPPVTTPATDDAPSGSPA